MLLFVTIKLRIKCNLTLSAKKLTSNTVFISSFLFNRELEPIFFTKHDQHPTGKLCITSVLFLHWVFTTKLVELLAKAQHVYIVVKRCLKSVKLRSSPDVLRCISILV